MKDEIDLILQTSKADTMSTSVSSTISKYMTFYRKDYALYTETEMNSSIISGIEHNSLVHITLGGYSRVAIIWKSPVKLKWWMIRGLVKAAEGVSCRGC